MCAWCIRLYFFPASFLPSFLPYFFYLLFSRSDAALLIRAFAYGSMGAMLVAGVSIYGLFKLSLLMANEAGREGNLAAAKSLARAGRAGRWASAQLEGATKKDPKDEGRE